MLRRAFCLPFLTSICSQCSSPPPHRQHQRRSRHENYFHLKRAMFSDAICRWVTTFSMNCCARPGDACCLCEYSVVCFGLDQNMARSVRPWTLFGQHPTANMNILNCWKDIGTTNTPQSRWVWRGSYCSAPQRISVYWRTPLSASSNFKLSTTAASFKQI